MSQTWQNGQMTVRHMRVKGPDLDPTLTQLRVTSLLNMVDLHPKGLPPSAIVCIRTLRDPLPGALPIHGGGASPPRVWERAAVALLDQEVRVAVHPARGAVPATANAVFFTDCAELLACLASDWCQGNVATRWWWQSIFTEIDLGQGILPAWLSAPEYIPAALQQLAVRKEVVPFVRSLHGYDVRSLIQVIIFSFAVHGLQTVIDSGLDGNVPLPAFQTDEPQRDSSEKGVFIDRGERQFEGDSSENAWLLSGEIPTSDMTGKENSHSTFETSPWEHIVPESDERGLQIEQQLLLGIGLMLHRAPMQLRARSFAQEVQQWLTQSTRVSSIWQMPTGRPRLSRQHPPRPPDRSFVREISKESSDERWHKDDIQQMVHALEEAQHPSAPDNDSMSQLRSTIDQQEIPKESDTTTSSQAPDSEFLAGETLQAFSVDTTYGGIFYLLNVGLALDLYNDFTMPLGTGIPLSIWDFLALLGQALVGDSLRLDSIWSLLAQLAGREDQDWPGHDFEPPDTWRIPIEWMSVFEEDMQQAWLWSVEDGRLRVLHPAQFMILDVPLIGGNSKEQLRLEMQEYYHQVDESDTPLSGMHLLSTHRITGVSPEVERWLNWLVPYIRVRLCGALRLTRADTLVPMLCEHTARILVTSTHLDVFLSLQELPIEIRIAGLDRDPGWIPAAGRFVAFHFE